MNGGDFDFGRYEEIMRRKLEQCDAGMHEGKRRLLTYLPEKKAASVQCTLCNRLLRVEMTLEQYHSIRDYDAF